MGSGVFRPRGRRYLLSWRWRAQLICSAGHAECPISFVSPEERIVDSSGSEKSIQPVPGRYIPK